MNYLTSRFCRAVVSAYAGPLPIGAERAAERTAFNALGTTIGASRSPASKVLIAHAQTVGGKEVASVLGTDVRTDPYHAAIINGTAGHFDDFDDTHLETVIHPGTATLAVALAAGQVTSATGSDALRAFALGCEAQLRMGLSISPSHYDAGWHITGTCGVLGTTITAGLLVGLDATQLEAALGVAASFTLGHREAFGTMTKPLHPGKAAANGFLAATMVADGLTAPLGILEAPRGVFRVLSEEDDSKFQHVDESFGTRWELELNTFKPYPCGIVSHPAIDAAVELSPRVVTSAIRSVQVHCHPLVPELTGNPDPQDGLQARFSTIHGVAAGLADGEVGLTQYDDLRVVMSDLVALRSKITLVPDEKLRRAEAHVEVLTTEGASIEHHVKHARGSLQRPLDDEELRAKVHSLVEPVLGDRVDELRAAIDALKDADDLNDLIKVGRP